MYISSAVAVDLLTLGLDAVTQCLLQKATPPLIDLSKNLYISGVGHKSIILLTRFSAADMANWLIVMKWDPSKPSSLLVIFRKCSKTSHSWRTSISKYLSMYSPKF